MLSDESSSPSTASEGEEEEKGWESVSTKPKEKNANRPKQPQNPYSIWVRENQSKLKEVHPGLSVTELATKAWEIWNEEVMDKPVGGRIFAAFLWLMDKPLGGMIFCGFLW